MEDLHRRIAGLVEQADQWGNTGPFNDSWESLQTRGVSPWFRDAKFGIFIHWLVSSVPAFGSEWYARNMYVPGTPEYEHHLATYGPQAEHGFKEFIASFTAEKFSAGDWVRLFKRAGAQYMVPVSEHHDGFALYDSSLTPWSAAQMGPKRDVIGELRTAARDSGMGFGVSNHRAENWWFYNGGTRYESDVLDPENARLYGPARSHYTQPDERFLDEWLARLVDTVEKYDPDLVYFDWWIEQPAFRPYLARFSTYLYNRGLARGGDPVINYKWNSFEPGSAVQDIERGIVQGIQANPFQNDTSASRLGWGYLEEDDFKSVAEVIMDLVDTVSKNGSLLLNVGPKPDGTFPDEVVGLLEGVGDWLGVNGQAIYGTRPWRVYGEGPTVPAAQSFADAAPIPYTPTDVRFTCREGAVYACFLAWPESTAIVRTLGSNLRLTPERVEHVELLGHGAVPFRIEGDGLYVDLPRERRSLLPVLKVSMSDPPSTPRHEPGFAE